MIHKALRCGLLQDCQARDSVRLRCQDSASCSAWSRAPPSTALGTKLPGDKVRTILRWQLGIAVLNPAKAGSSTTVCQQCGDALDAFGDHAVSCTNNNLWQRHYLVQDFLLRQCRSAGIQCLREQSLLHTERREADLLIPNWSGTRALAIDITIRHPRALGLPFVDPDGILLAAETEKRKFAQNRAHTADCLFEPLVLHTWSGCSGKGTSRSFLNNLLNKIAYNRPGADKPAKLNEMVQGLSCIVAAQVADQIAAAIGPWEIPVMPAWEIPLRVDEYGNGLPGVSKPHRDSYSEINRRTRQRTSTTQDERSTSFTWSPPTPADIVGTSPDSDNSPNIHNPSGFRIRQATTTPAKGLPDTNPATETSTHLLDDDPEAKELVDQLTRVHPNWEISDPWSPFHVNNQPLLVNIPLLPLPTELSPTEQALINELMVSLTVNASEPYTNPIVSPTPSPVPTTQETDPVNPPADPELATLVLETANRQRGRGRGREHFKSSKATPAQTRKEGKRFPRKKHR